MGHLSKVRWLRILVVSMVLLLSFAGTTFASTTPQIDYVALGDSLAAGWTPYSTADDPVIDKSYTDFIAEKLDGEGVLASYTDSGYPGLRTVHVMQAIDPTNPDNSEMVAAIAAAEMITLDIGANDLIDSIPDLIANPDTAPAAISGVAANIGRIVATLKTINPRAKICLMGYYNAFPYYPEAGQAAIVTLIKGLNTAIEGVARQTHITYVDTFTIMDKHLTKYLPVDNIHPTVSGYRAIAKEFWSVIKVDFLRGLN